MEGSTVYASSSRDSNEKGKVDDVNLEAGGVMRPTKKAIPGPDVKQPNFIKRMFGKGKKDGEEEKGDGTKTYIPVSFN